MASQVVPTAALHLCSHCQGLFPSVAALGQHLIDVNTLRVLSANAAQLFSSPAPAQIASQAPVAAAGSGTGTFTPGIVEYYNAKKNYGFLRRSTSGSPRSQVFFHVSICSVQTPVPTPGEAVLFREKEGIAANKKGPTAAVVQRVAIGPSSAPVAAKKKNKGKSKPKPQAQPQPEPQPQPQHCEQAAPTRAISNPQRANDLPPTEPATEEPPIELDDDEVADQIQHMLRVLARPYEFEIYLPSAISLLARTAPVRTRGIQCLDPEAQRQRLVDALESELDRLGYRTGADHDDNADLAMELNFGYMPPPLRLAQQRLPRVAVPALAPPPATAPLRTMHCGICMEVQSIEELFSIRGCAHEFCRECMRKHLLMRLDRNDARPTCPDHGCDVELSDVEVTQVLTPEEQDRYYQITLKFAVAQSRTLFRCIHSICPGVGELPPEDPHFVCPVCDSEYCVLCNTREWHDGLTCEQHRQRDHDSELHPEQLFQLYGNNDRVHQCGGCGYGPIEHDACYDVGLHHNEAVGDTGVRYDNRCPSCGWFDADINNWPQWNPQQR